MTSSDLPKALLEEAAIWHARMREPQQTEKFRARFDRWLEADPRHALAYAEAQRFWAVLEAPAAEVMATEPATNQVVFRQARGTRALFCRPMTWRRAAIVASLCLAVGGWASWKTGFLDDLRSDYVTATGDRQNIILADGSEVDLNTDTALAVALGPDQRVVRLFHGEAWFSVAHNAARPFFVETPEGSVRVTGTRFNVRLAEDRAIVSLVEGSVRLTSTDASIDKVMLVPGQQAVVTSAGIEAPENFDISAVTAWQRGQLVFYQMPLADVVEELNRYRPGRIMVMSDRLRDLRVTGVFDAGNPDTALAVIQDTLHVSVTKLTDYLVLLH